MEISAPHDSIGKFFESKPIYTVPKYQRAYAWEYEEINDFLGDLENCFNKRLSGNPIDHFFGGIVCVVHKVKGSRGQNSYELVDGQQRLATIVLLVSCILDNYQKLKLEANQSNDNLNEGIIIDRIEEWQTRFVQFNLEVNRKSTLYDVLTLSGADELFFKNLVLGNNPSPSRDSHKRMLDAKNKISEKVNFLTKDTNLVNRIDKLEIIQQIIEIDFSIIRIETENRDNAYRLFQVLNNRGKSLTEGDLLRARTLELLEGHTVQQDNAVKYWDQILSDAPNVTSNFLRYIYSSHYGSSPGSRTLYNDFLDKFFPFHIKETLNNSEANVLMNGINDILKEITLCRKLVQGIWPFVHSSPIQIWDRSRLDLLINSLGHTLCLPLLLSASKLDHILFSELINLIERFVFRFIIISGQHPSKLSKVYLEESAIIRRNPSAYLLNSIRTKLAHLQSTLATSAVFNSNLDTLIYQKGGGNKPIKYFLITIENYLRWFNGGAIGNPVCFDKTFYYNFNDTTIEHIYPRNASGSVIDNGIESLKNTFGNLTIMGPTDNGKGSNDSFIIKRPLFNASSVEMNREIGLNIQWDVVKVNDRALNLKDMANKIFSV